MISRLRPWRRTHLGTEADRATFRTLHTASLAAPALREGLTEASAERSLRHLRTLLGTPSAALTDTDRVLAWAGLGHHHAAEVERAIADLTDDASTRMVRADACEDGGCPVGELVISPLVVEEVLVGSLVVGAPTATGSLVRAANEVAAWVSGQLELASLDDSRTALMEAEVRALRAQISPHFIYNSLGAIASFVRTDPDRARELLLEFADFTRYSFRSHGAYTTLAEELRSVERYLLLEQARFGDRLKVVLKIAPEVLPVAIPFLCIQPLVENAVRHGLEASVDKADGVGQISITARDLGQECVIEVEDDGAGEDPERVRRALAGDATMDSVGLGNVDARLRNAYGDDHGLVVETAPGAGTKVVVRVPKFAPGVHA
ncbi:sensor histidine kinase [Nocardioides piscis]|uniref:Sensor histidine kinase n=1 Tax=Nocardioides piscis TaxID=2714938 RepID=A0A6G7YDC3_9ACTN|nr:histidine kinase [Nocardioides piscis]QIK74638.1 sensor histidine kinase [Nocardioides piscis]